MHLREQLLTIARELHVRERRERLHDSDEIERTELFDKCLERPPQRQHDLRRLLDVVIVEENHEQTDVVACRLRAAVVEGSNLNRFFVVGRYLAGEANELHGLDRLREPVLLDLKVLALEIVDWLVVAAGHGHIDANELDFGAKRRLRRWGLLLRAGQTTGGAQDKHRG
jgi:hypothetical protein